MNKEDLKFNLARGVLLTTDHHPRDPQITQQQLPVVLRPWWSNVEIRIPSWPGGQLKAEDFEGILTAEQMEDPQYRPNQDQLTEAGVKALERKVVKEIGIMAVGLLYINTTSTIDDQGRTWTTHFYGAEYPEKQQLITPPDSDGSFWVMRSQITDSEYEMVPGYLQGGRDALKALNDRQQKKRK